MSKKKEQLGKGLRALLTKIDNTETPKAVKQQAIAEISSTANELDITAIEANPFQPRTEFRKEELLELVQSIKSYGLIQPITVRKISSSKYQIISGERRWRASKLAGLKKVPVYIRIADDQGMLELALVENIQRSDLNALEIAISYQRLIDECNLQHDELAKRVGKERSTVTNYTRILKLPPDIQAALREKKISMGHAKALLAISDSAQQLILFNKTKSGNLSVRQLEAEVRTKKNPKSSSKKTNPTVHPEIAKIKDRLSNQLGCRVEISRKKSGSGKITLQFASDDQLNDIIELIEAE